MKCCCTLQSCHECNESLRVGWCQPPGGRLQLQLVLMRHPPQLSVKTCGGGGGVGAGGGGDRQGVLAAWPGGGGGAAARNPLLSHAYLKGVSGGMGV